MKFVLASLLGAAAAADCDCLGVANVVTTSSTEMDTDGTTPLYTTGATGEFPGFLTTNGYAADYGDSCQNWDKDELYCDSTDASYVDEDWCDDGYAWCYVKVGACDDATATSYFAGTDFSDAEWYDCSSGYGSFGGWMGDNLGMTFFLLLIFPIGV